MRAFVRACFLAHMWPSSLLTPAGHDHQHSPWDTTANKSQYVWWKKRGIRSYFESIDMVYGILPGRLRDLVSHGRNKNQTALTLQKEIIFRQKRQKKKDRQDGSCSWPFSNTSLKQVGHHKKKTARAFRAILSDTDRQTRQTGGRPGKSATLRVLRGWILKMRK